MTRCTAWDGIIGDAEGTMLLGRKMGAPVDIPEKREEAGESIPGIHIALDYVEGEVVGPAERPDCYAQQQSRPHSWGIQPQQSC